MSRRISNEETVVADQLHSASIHLLRKLRREDAASGLNAARLSALSVIVFAGPITPGDLAAAEQVRPPTMTRIVDALVQHGLAEKKKTRKTAVARSFRPRGWGRSCCCGAATGVCAFWPSGLEDLIQMIVMC